MIAIVSVTHTHALLHQVGFEESLFLRSPFGPVSLPAKPRELHVLRSHFEKGDLADVSVSQARRPQTVFVYIVNVCCSVRYRADLNGKYKVSSLALR